MTIDDSKNSEAPWASHAEVVRPEWIDYNGHMNVAYYVLVFDHATDAALDHLGIGEVYRKATKSSVFVGEMHVTYEREVRAGEPIRVASRILAFDNKRLIVFHEMRNNQEDLVATNEVLCLHVDLASRRTAPLPARVAERIERIAVRHARLSRPSRTGRAIGLDVRRPQ